MCCWCRPARPRAGGAPTASWQACSKSWASASRPAPSDYRVARHLRRTVLMTDLAEAAAMRRALTRALRRHRPRAIVYSSSQAAMLQPRVRLEARGGPLRRCPLPSTGAGPEAGCCMPSNGAPCGGCAFCCRGVSRPTARRWRSQAACRSCALPVPIDVPARNRARARSDRARVRRQSRRRRDSTSLVQAWSDGGARGLAAGRHRDRCRCRSAVPVSPRGVEIPPGIEWAGSLEPTRYRGAARPRERVPVRIALRGLRPRPARGAGAQGALLVTCPSEGRYRGARDPARARPAPGRGRHAPRRRSPGRCRSQCRLSTEERLSLQKRARMHLQPYSREEVEAPPPGAGAAACSVARAMRPRRGPGTTRPFRDALARPDLRLPAEQPSRLLGRGPAPLHVHLERWAGARARARPGRCRTPPRRSPRSRAPSAPRSPRC